MQGDPTSPSWRRSVLGVHWKDWCWSWNSNTLATWCEELTHWKRPWCWEGLGAGREGDNSGWDGWMASLTQWTWVWVNSGSWWWTGRPGMLQSMGSQRVGHNWATELNWTELNDRTTAMSISAFLVLIEYIQLFQHCLLKRLSLLLYTDFAPLTKMRWPYLWGSISDLSSFSHWSICLFFHQHHTVFITVALQ